ncbi:MAG: N-acetylmuramoyl-L-alanine amidase [Lachnospiraceae bacterium]
MAYKVAIDAGHGGSDPGAVYQNRREKDDAFRLANAVGDILLKNGIDVFYVRNTDEYETPFRKATKANSSGADLFVSIHRNSSESPNQYTGVETLVYNDSGMKADLARDINSRLEQIGFKNLGVDERPNLVVLKRTQMPAVLVEAGFINNDKDNRLFDENFDEIAQAIADSILNVATDSAATDTLVPAIPVSEPNEPDVASVVAEDGPEKLYRVQVGAYRNKENADRLLNSLYAQGFPAFVIYDDGLYKVQVGAFQFLSNAIKMEERLRNYRYNTFITV